MKILIIGACRLAEGYGSCGKALTDMGFDVAFFPLFTMKHLERSYTDILLFANGNLPDEIRYLYDSIIDDTPGVPATICLWWHHVMPIELSEFKHICNTCNAKNILLDWDPCCEVTNKKWCAHYKPTLDVLHLLDQLITTNGNIYEYIKNVVKNKNYKCDVQHFFPGYHPSITYPTKNPEYECDINMVCTNLYENGFNGFDDLSIINRHKLVNEIYKDKRINFHLYGPECFKTQYPDAYKGRIEWENTNKVFYNSKLSLNITPVGNLNDSTEPNSSAKKYMSDRVSLILGSGGTLLSDGDYSGIFTPGKHYIRVKSISDAMKKIRALLNNDPMRMTINRNGYEASKETLLWSNTFKDIVKIWDKWGST